jgi:predicted dehydrogenase
MTSKRRDQPIAKVIGVGVIGMGWMGFVHARAYRAVWDRFHEQGLKARLVICADDVLARAREAQERLGFEQSASDWRQVATHPEVDVVSITTPNYLHFEMIRAAAEAKKHVFCEKPVGCSGRQTAEITGITRRAGVLTWVGYNYRWAPLVQYARQLIADGQLGTLQHYRGRFYCDYGSDPNAVLSWRFERDRAGHGALGDLMSHVLDMTHMLAGPIRRVVANQKTMIRTRPVPDSTEASHYSVKPDSPRAPVTNEDYVGALVDFANGAPGNLEVCRVMNGPRCEMAFEFHGTKGAVSWNYERMNELEVFLPDGTPAHDGRVLIQAGEAHPAYSAFYPGRANAMGYEDLKAIESLRFLESVARNQQGEPGFAQELQVAAVQEAMARSFGSERWETVAPLAES